MATMINEQVVLLGTVLKNQSVDNTSPLICKAGGIPAWYNAMQPVGTNSLICPNCNRSLFLLAQVYAPMDYDRTLYVFGCNSIACTQIPGSWRVLRDEKHINEDKSIQDENKDQSCAKMEAVNKATSNWMDDDASDWSEDEEISNTEEPDIDIEALLLKRDDAMQSSSEQINSKPKEISTNKVSEVTELLNSQTDTPAFPCVYIDVIDEPFENVRRTKDFRHEELLLEQYMKQEESENASDIAALRQAMNSTSQKYKQSKNNTANETTNSNNSAVSNGLIESYEKVPAKQRNFLRFKTRIERYPTQCLRYEYGGEPLWPIPIPSTFQIPKCSCGLKREFECQLLPTILNYLQVDNYVIDNGNTSKETSNEKSNNISKVLGAGMDWLSIYIYSCPKSCKLSHEEYPYIIPAISS